MEIRVIRKLCYNLMTNPKYDITDFHIVIDFVRNYADKHHYGKEENTPLYKFAGNMLSNNSKSFLEDKCKKAEELATDAGIQEKYINLLEILEKKYL